MAKTLVMRLREPRSAMISQPETDRRPTKVLIRPGTTDGVHTPYTVPHLRLPTAYTLRTPDVHQRLGPLRTPLDAGRYRTPLVPFGQTGRTPLVTLPLRP